ncbi:cysteine hydrolase family protein [Rhodoplanes sp. Z2-YC6860]|uniref:cysteine hydrolase family protein n=1 Tax=Rhodoplanes sp. Z2-YC6860 TaxID=674703 RepID=UPI000A72CA2D|nr:isochorismatase family cysteine hydrolase [Rhodoplanes sp. Z2-YC6860]
MLKTLTDKVRPQHCALLIVDMQNDFCAEGGAMHREGRDVTLVQKMVPRLAQFITAARAAKVPLVWIKNVYNTGPNWYLSESWLEQAERRRNGAYLTIPVCEPNAWNGDFYEVRPEPDEVIVTKHRYGAFESTDLDLVLRSRGICTVIMTGVATNVCVETTARQAFLRDYYVVFSSDCTATFNQAAHDMTLQNIDAFFGQVASAAEITACWQAAPVRLRAVT